MIETFWTDIANWLKATVMLVFPEMAIKLYSTAHDIHSLEYSGIKEMTQNEYVRRNFNGKIPLSHNLTLQNLRCFDSKRRKKKTPPVSDSLSK